MGFLRELFLNNAIGMILSSVKNPESQAKFKLAFLKVRNAINAAYAGDPDFE